MTRVKNAAAHYLRVARVQAAARWREALPVVTLAGLFALALVERVRTEWRRRSGAPPRLIWGPVPVISLKYWSNGMRDAGWESTTAVAEHYAINQREDFDVHADQFRDDYRFFAWALRNGDVFIRFFDGGFLRATPAKWRENALLRLAGKKLIVSPYGSDIAVAGHLGELEAPLFEDYPYLRDLSDQTERWVLHTTRWADLRIRHHQPGFLPEYDVVLPNHFAIDTSQWDEVESRSDNDGTNGPVSIFHAPNHRNIKGTDHLERAVAELRDEGLDIDLRIVQRRPNHEIRALLSDSDIAADQFLSPGYAMFSIEAMALGKPVLNNIATLPADLRATDVIAETPAVDTDPERLKGELRRLITNPDLRAEIGRAGPKFVERYHSGPALAREWAAMVDHVWKGAPLPSRLVPQPLPSPVAQSRKDD